MSFQKLSVHQKINHQNNFLFLQIFKSITSSNLQINYIFKSSNQSHFQIKLMEVLQSILENSQYAFITAILLGLMTAISPCPLATNISAIGFISRDIENRRRVFLSGLVYTLGRAISYTALAVVIYLGAGKMNISMVFLMQRSATMVLMLCPFYRTKIPPI